MKTTVLLVDDHRIARQGLRYLLSVNTSLEIVGEAVNAREAIAAATSLKPHVVIMDVSMPGMDGVEATERIVRGPSSPAVIACSMHLEKSYVKRMFAAGAKGYVSKDCDYEELLEAITAAREGKSYISKALQEHALSEYLEDCHPAAKTLLTKREMQVLLMTAEGLAMKEIAYQLRKSVKTVEACRRRLMKKLEAATVADLVKYAVREKLTPV